MVVGYSLGNRNDLDNDIEVIGEDDPNVITYSSTTRVSLTRTCRNRCPYCSFRRHDELTVPYSTIKLTKSARLEGVREAVFVSGESPDRFTHIQSSLDLWGFSSYVDYLYTVCELGFLEGVIPVADLGFLTPSDLRRLSEICAVLKVNIDSVDPAHFSKVYPESPGKRYEIRLKLLEWAGKLKFPVSASIMVGIGESKTHRKAVLNDIAALHRTYGHIHDVVIQNFSPQSGTKFERRSAPNRKEMLDVVDVAKGILPEDILVSVPIELNTGIGDFIKAGVRDLGRVPHGSLLYIQDRPFDWDAVISELDALGYRLQQRFPLKKAFIQEGLYSKKLGQVFESYRYKIKKDVQEKAKLNK